MSFLSELKRRNVFKVGAAYLALAWLVLQLTSIVVPEFELPAGTMKLVIWIGVIGFPCALVFAWIYELTPEGLKRDGEVDPGTSIMHLTGRRLDYTIVVLLVLAIGMAALQFFRPPAAPAVATSDATVTPAAPAAEVAAPVSEVPAPESVSVAPLDKSIAVLPFADMSQAKDQEYLSDGMSEELLNLLAKAPDLKVIARTSSFSFKGTNTPIAEIARQLNVTHVLEGSVRKSGNTVRITAQLIHAADSTHLWSETYDRPLDDIFKVQDEIARAVVEQLKIRLLGAAPKAEAVDAQAYALYLQGRQLVHQLNLGAADSYERAVSLYQQALAIDPAYARAWAGLAWTYAVQTTWGTRTVDEGLQLARDAAERALAIDPAEPKAHQALGLRALALEQDLAAAARHFARGLQIDPRDADLIRGTTLLLMMLGRTEESLAFARYLLSIDPLNPWAHATVANVFNIAGRWDEAIATYRTVLALRPGYTGMHYPIGIVLLQRNQTTAALEEFRLERESGGPGMASQGTAIALHALGRHAESDAELAGLSERFGAEWPSMPAAVHAATGNRDAAFELLERALARREPYLNQTVLFPEFRSLRDDSRWLPLLRRIGMAPEQVAAIEFDVKVPQP